MTETRTKLFRTTSIALAGLAMLATAGTALAGNKDLGLYKQWQAHSYEQAGATVCNMWSQPTKHKEGGKNRGDIYAFVTHRPSSKRYHEVSFDMGYPIKKNSDVVLAIGSKKFMLYPHGNSAFARDKDEGPIVNAMRRGLTMVIRGISSRGTKTTDTYSLRGFTRAHRSIGKACKAPKP